MPAIMACLDDYLGADDDARFAAAIADLSLREIKLTRATVVTQTIVPRSILAIYGAGKFAGEAGFGGVFLQKFTPGPMFSSSGVYGFHIINLGMYGGTHATDCVSLVDADECSVRGCLIKNFIGHGIQFDGSQTVKCLSTNNRISAAATRLDSSRGIYFSGGGNCARSEYDYVARYGVNIESSSSSTKIEQATVETADNGIRVSGGDCIISGGISNACANAIVQAGSFWVSNDFMRNAYAGNCIVSDSSKWRANWNGA